MTLSRHARCRAQQRGIPRLVEEWLDQYGEEDYDGHGAVRRYFSKRGLRRLEKHVGRIPVRRMADFLNTYKVESIHTGYVLTIGVRTRRFRRK